MEMDGNEWTYETERVASACKHSDALIDAN